MVDVKPFRPYIYNKERVDINKVISPPYDIIEDIKDGDIKKYLDYKYNIIKVIKNKKYDKAAELLNDWIKDRVLTIRKAPSFYVLNQRFEFNGKDYSTNGIIILAKIDDNQIVGHEKVDDSIVEERRKLIVATGANTGLILTYVVDRQKFIRTILKGNIYNNREFSFRGIDGTINTLYRVENRETTSLLESHLKDERLYILDGHHRYEASKRIWESSSGIKNDEPLNYVMTCITADPNLIILDHSKKPKKGELPPLHDSVALTDIISTADAGETLNQKSTYFYPKKPSGLTIYRFDSFNSKPSSFSYAF